LTDSWEIDVGGLVFGGTLALALLAAGAASAQPMVAGIWHVSGKISSGKTVDNQLFEIEATCLFMQSGEQISGNCTGPDATGPITGVVAGNSIEWTWRSHATTALGVAGMTGFNGTIVRAGQIEGTMTSTASTGKGTFTQTR